MNFTGSCSKWWVGGSNLGQIVIEQDTEPEDTSTCGLEEPGDQTTNILDRGQPALPPELQLPLDMDEVLSVKLFEWSLRLENHFINTVRVN